MRKPTKMERLVEPVVKINGDPHVLVELSRSLLSPVGVGIGKRKLGRKLSLRRMRNNGDQLKLYPWTFRTTWITEPEETPAENEHGNVPTKNWLSTAASRQAWLDLPR
jgi:hypothetical protein